MSAVLFVFYLGIIFRLPIIAHRHPHVCVQNVGFTGNPQRKSAAAALFDGVRSRDADNFGIISRPEFLMWTPFADVCAAPRPDSL